MKLLRTIRISRAQVLVSAFALVLGFSVAPYFFHPVSAEDTCKGTAGGNLQGYIDTENVGKIYVSKESWDEDHPDDPADADFYVSYDTERGTWSGKAWNEKIGWVNFSYDEQNHLARFMAPGEEYDRLHDNDPNNDEPVEWGNWKAVVDLSNVRYSVQDGRFVGTAEEYDDNTGEGDEDDAVGSGTWIFDNLVLRKPDCPEQINLLLNERSVYEKAECPIDEKEIIIQWTSEGVHDCKSVEGPWVHKERPSEYTGREVRNTEAIDGSARFTIRCVGDYTNTEVQKSATAKCGKAAEEENETNGTVCEGTDCPIIAPKIIEA